ncbi:MAG TPA: lytic transglycosylase domain-containing protein [Usitatibacter sp.]|nr:lytic transglycosylase domain-containing protein [Usitatibacter sp.]
MSLLLAALALCVGCPAMADIYMFKDERGVVHFTNIPNGDKRYKMVRKEESTSDYTRAAGMPQYVLPTAELIRQYSAIIESAAKAHGVETALVHAVITAESGYNPRAVSRAGAQGIMQLMPDTARRFGVRNSFDAVQNIQGGVKYLRELLTMFNGNRELALAAYNAGENAVIRAGNRIPPYAETMHYVPKVLGFYRKFQTARL